MLASAFSFSSSTRSERKTRKIVKKIFFNPLSEYFSNGERDGEKPHMLCRLRSVGCLQHQKRFSHASDEFSLNFQREFSSKMNFFYFRSENFLHNQTKNRRKFFTGNFNNEKFVEGETSLKLVPSKGFSSCQSSKFPLKSF